MIDEYRSLGILNFEMEAGTLFKMGGVYGFAPAASCAIVAQRDRGASASTWPSKDAAVAHAIDVAIAAADTWDRS